MSESQDMVDKALRVLEHIANLSPASIAAIESAIKKEGLLYYVSQADINSAARGEIDMAEVLLEGLRKYGPLATGKESA